MGLNGTNLVRLGAGPARTNAGHPDALQHRLELRTVVPLSAGHEQGKRLLALLDRKVRLGGQSAARASEAVIVRHGGAAVERGILSEKGRGYPGFKAALDRIGILGSLRRLLAGVRGKDYPAFCSPMSYTDKNYANRRHTSGIHHMSSDNRRRC
ncbi:hypothetical protein ADK77_06475 [Streptomyces antibioticus]|nr:hypothetical protein ADK77_06475 [Streptomyces antibioticus]